MLGRLKKDELARTCVGNGNQIEFTKLPYIGLPPGKKKRDRPRATQRRTITSELEEMQVKCIAKHKRRWRQIVDVPCPIGYENDK